MVFAYCVQDKEPVFIDMAQRLTELGLISLIPESLWPPVNALRELATIQRALRRTGQQNAFICADLHKWVLFFTCRAQPLGPSLAGFCQPFAQNIVWCCMTRPTASLSRAREKARVQAKLTRCVCVCVRVLFRVQAYWSLHFVCVQGVLGLAQWQMAWDSHALALAMLGLMSYASALSHKRIVLEVACDAAVKRGTLVGVLYDKIVQ